MLTFCWITPSCSHTVRLIHFYWFLLGPTYRQVWKIKPRATAQAGESKITRIYKQLEKNVTPLSGRNNSDTGQALVNR